MRRFTRWDSATPEERFWAKVDKDGPIPAHRPDLGPCWIWTGGTKGTAGYGRFRVDSEQSPMPYRVSYTWLVGPIDDGLTLDHLCHNGSGCAGGPTCPHRSCVNPAHLDPVSAGINVLRGEGHAARNARKDHCPAGHPYSEANIYRWGGRRYCRTCRSNA